jgi:hypothetical protein
LKRLYAALRRRFVIRQITLACSDFSGRQPTGEVAMLATKSFCSTAGMLNGIFGEGQSGHIAHWQSVKIVDKTEEQNEDGTLTIREKERFANELTLAFANGRVTTLK